MLTLVTWLRKYSSFHCCKVTLFPFFPHCLLWKEHIMDTSHLNSGKVYSPLLHGWVATAIIWIPSAQSFLLFSMDIYFVFWTVIQYYFKAQIMASLAIGNTFSCLLCLLDIILCVCVCVCLNTSLLSGSTRYPRFILCISLADTRIDHVSKQPWFILMENDTRNENPGSVCAYCYWSIISFTSS